MRNAFPKSFLAAFALVSFSTLTISAAVPKPKVIAGHAGHGHAGHRLAES